ncbi:uncharacterized protein LOC110254175 isoform X2 [Exaiptasia diaphana]|uniref:PUB domain-containing protein n=1 Tax=Exaiptasia diaphana TaxID=2652724 RepID=A0A913Y951_EXADI|nr:uncharacterized protein LOC110254175 isoform X2 [Exaiptasia diaphana]
MSSEDLLNAYQSLIQLDTVEAYAALKLIKVYVDVIAGNPDSPEFRTICIRDANFYTTVWQLEEAQAFLLAAGFEELIVCRVAREEELLILPDHVDIGAIKALFKDEEAEKACEKLKKDLQSIGQIYVSDDDFIEENKRRSKEVFGMMMRAHFRKSRDDKFQPCQDEIDFLRSTPKGVALCHDLRRASLKSFYKILYPEIDTKEGLGERDSIFHLDKDSVKNDKTELDDQNKRAKALARVVKDAHDGVTIHLLDGHGRMLHTQSVG